MPTPSEPSSTPTASDRWRTSRRTKSVRGRGGCVLDSYTMRARPGVAEPSPGRRGTPRQRRRDVDAPRHERDPPPALRAAGSDLGRRRDADRDNAGPAAASRPRRPHPPRALQASQRAQGGRVHGGARRDARSAGPARNASDPATRCIESGVDIPTVSRWLGHKDGGALAMKTYGHLRREHSIAQAQRVTFATTSPSASTSCASRAARAAMDRSSR